MLEAVRSGVPLEMPEDLIEQINSAQDGEDDQKTADDTQSLDNQSTDQEGEATDNAEVHIRVRATLIDKLTNLAGELSISRAQMEQQQGTIKNHLEEMEETVIRLRDQLRRLEIETEAQIISHFIGRKELDQNEEFDPLELDRFSTLQLSRSLMESVNDLNSIQEYLKNQTRQSDSLLIQQSRIGAELQENIMRTGMIPFAKISPRLKQIARKTAKELHKTVNLVINGENTEFERTVLDRIKAPHEYLLRNAIKHGIEYAPTRQQAGKSSTGTITLDLFREGTELIIRLSDDGSGLDLPAIRQQAEQLGFIQPDTEIDDNELMQFILEPGFSTAKTVVQVAGQKDIAEPIDEIMAIFLEEAEELIENSQSLLELWQVAPKNMPLIKELQRELHTLKGGARIVGIVPMGNLSHHLESVLTRIVEGVVQSNTKLQEIIQNSVDELAAMLEAVRSCVPLEIQEALIRQINSALGGEEETEETPVVNKFVAPSSTSNEEDTQKPVPPTDHEGEATDNTKDNIQVRATLIDKLTNITGELSISKSQIEQQQSTIKYHLDVMEETVIRLRDQLRRFEIETETQIISHFSGSKEIDQNEEFDPLELDRFSTIQQLSRSLMESVSDLSNIQEYLKNRTRQSDSLLIQESRIGAELQENIMRIRMIPFAAAPISSYLQKIARETAIELEKPVNFVINGENTLFERTVLDSIKAPHEHLLRNAICHGIEDAEMRQQAGKSRIGKITLDLFREGTELIIRLSDDGRGLDLPAIRKKAEQRGLIQPDKVIDDNELMQFILKPGFSTAKKVSQVSGRGVGMDVVSTEIKKLGGSLQIHSKTGKGTTFEIRLPLSLTINQALLVRVGDETMAVPMNHVDAVMQAESAEVLSEPNKVRYYQYMDKKYHIFHLGELLGFGQTASAEIPLIPMLLVRAGDRRVALLVDGIEGSKEIVVKSVGSQIGAIRWISGATILGDGRVVLILDMPVLCRADATPQSVPTQVVEVVKEEKPNAKTIMVVDDSITVRKVTSRLLKRQGMDVLVAKDGIDAVTQLQENIPDLMLLDVEMPRMDGYELATTVRNNPDWKHIPIIIITSRTGAKHRDKAEKIGINRYLGKPFNETELLENINALLA